VATDAEKITRLEREIEELKAENERLRRALEEALRSAKRQAAPFSRRHPKAHPQKPGGVRRFCPRFFEMGTTDRRTFWAYFFQALAGAEAGLNPNTSIRHSEPESAMATRSEGLLQLAYADHKRYGCDFNWQVDRALKANDPAKTILQPKNNLECGVKILVNQTIIQHKPLLSRSGYWSTLRPDGPSYHVFAKQMTNPPAACGLSTKSTIDKAATTKSVQDDAKRGETPK
jgi:hypothetical protein